MKIPNPFSQTSNIKKKSRIRETVGKPPGSLIYTGEKREEPVRITVIQYNDDGYIQEEVESLDKAFSYLNSEYVTWINIDGIHDTEMVKDVGERVNLHNLLLEDILSVDQRPKIEEFDDKLLVIFKMLYFKDNDLEVEHTSIILSEHSIISFQEKIGDIFDSLRSRIENKSGRIRQRGSDYLLYAIMDSIVDNYFIVLDEIAERLETLEDELYEDPGKDLLFKLQFYRKKVVELRRSVYPLRETVNKLNQGQSNLIGKDTEDFFKDLYDHTIQIIETIETFKDTIASLKDMYMSIVSNRMNEIMKVLTIIATIFIPLTFIAGVYGMNFENMPELGWEYGYFITWVIFILTFIGMIIYFKRKDWL